MFCRYETFRSRVSATSCRPRSAAASRNIYTSGPDQVFMNHSYERCPSTHENAISPDIDSQLRFVFESLQGHPAKRCSRSNSLDACEVTSQPQKRCCRLFDFLKHCIARWRLGDEVIRSICWYRMSLQSRSRIGCPALAPDPFHRTAKQDGRFRIPCKFCMWLHVLSRRTTSMYGGEDQQRSIKTGESWHMLQSIYALPQHHRLRHVEAHSLSLWDLVVRACCRIACW